LRIFLESSGLVFQDFPVTPPPLDPDELRSALRRAKFRVKALARQVSLDVRTLERRFDKQLCVTPKAWIIRERMRLALMFLAQGLSNKEIAASLKYTHESNFCRDFKRFFGFPPQTSRKQGSSNPTTSRFDKELSCFDQSKGLSG
jgi:AraC-like DNA-binding protein